MSDSRTSQQRDVEVDDLFLLLDQEGSDEEPVRRSEEPATPDAVNVDSATPDTLPAAQSAEQDSCITPIKPLASRDINIATPHLTDPLPRSDAVPPTTTSPFGFRQFPDPLQGQSVHLPFVFPNAPASFNLPNVFQPVAFPPITPPASMPTVVAPLTSVAPTSGAAPVVANTAAPAVQPLLQPPASFNLPNVFQPVAFPPITPPAPMPTVVAPLTSVAPTSAAAPVVANTPAPTVQPLLQPATSPTPAAVEADERIEPLRKLLNDTSAENGSPVQLTFAVSVNLTGEKVFLTATTKNRDPVTFHFMVCSSLYFTGLDGFAQGVFFNALLTSIPTPGLPLQSYELRNGATLRIRYPRENAELCLTPPPATVAVQSAETIRAAVYHHLQANLPTSLTAVLNQPAVFPLLQLRSVADDNREFTALPPFLAVVLMSSHRGQFVLCDPQDAATTRSQSMLPLAIAVSLLPPLPLDGRCVHVLVIGLCIRFIRGIATLDTTPGDGFAIVALSDPEAAGQYPDNNRCCHGITQRMPKKNLAVANDNCRNYAFVAMTNARVLQAATDRAIMDAEGVHLGTLNLVGDFTKARVGASGIPLRDQSAPTRPIAISIDSPCGTVIVKLFNNQHHCRIEQILRRAYANGSQFSLIGFVLNKFGNTYCWIPASSVDSITTCFPLERPATLAVPTASATVESTDRLPKRLREMRDKEDAEEEGGF